LFTKKALPGKRARLFLISRLIARSFGLEIVSERSFVTGAGGFETKN
jgi:hypothetical protein